MEHLGPEPPRAEKRCRILIRGCQLPIIRYELSIPDYRYSMLWGMSRWIIHVDMDEFFAAVERLDNPALRGKPLLVGGDPKARGVVSTASYEARAFGCHSAMPMATAVRRCPHAVVLQVRGQRYHQVSEQVLDILEQFSPMIEPLSIDEAFLDVSGCERLLGPAPEIGKQIKQRIRGRLGLTASVGVAPNKFLAKLASDLRKPDGLVVITKDHIRDVLDPLGIERLWGVGPAAAKGLRRLDIHTIGQLRLAPVELLRERFGQVGDHYHCLANGIDCRPVVPDSRTKSIGREQTFAADIEDMDELIRVLLNQTEQVARRLRRGGLKARSVTLKLRYVDFTTITRSATLTEPTNITEVLWRGVRRLLDKWAARHRRPLRLLGMTASQLTGREGLQETLFPDPQRTGQERIDEAMDRITERFGDRSICRGGTNGADRK